MLGSRRSMSMSRVDNKQRQKKMMQLPLYYKPTIEKNLTTSTTMDTHYTDDSYNSYDEEADYDDHSWQTSSSSLLQVASMIKRGHTNEYDESICSSKDTVSKKKYNISNSNGSSSRQRQYETTEKISLPSTVLKYMNKTENVVQKEDGPTKSILKDSPPRLMKTKNNISKANEEHYRQKEDEPNMSTTTAQSARQKRRIKAQAHVELKQQLERVATAKQKTKKETRRQRKVKNYQRMRKEYNEKKVLMKERQEFEVKRKEQLSTYLSKEDEEDSKEDESKEVDTSEDDVQAVTSQDTNHGAPSDNSTSHSRTFLDFVQHLIVEKATNESSVVSSLVSSNVKDTSISSVKNALPSPEDICKELQEVEEEKKNLQESTTTLDDIDIDMEASKPILPFDEQEASVLVEESNDNGYIQLLSDAAASRHRAKMVLRARELIKSRKDERAESDNDHTPSEVDF